MVFSAALFDLDGVLVDTAKYHFLAWHALARELGFAVVSENSIEIRLKTEIREDQTGIQAGAAERDPDPSLTESDQALHRPWQNFTGRQTLNRGDIPFVFARS